MSVIYKTISELDPTQTNESDDCLEVFQSGKSYKIKSSDLVKRDSYSLGVGTSTQLNIDNGVFTIDNSSASAKTILLPADLPVGRATTIVVVIRGKAGAVTWDAGINWSEGNAPKLGNTVTIGILLWDGVSVHGTPGATY